VSVKRNLRESSLSDVLMYIVTHTYSIDPLKGGVYYIHHTIQLQTS
jgi:hypothetical protein